LRESGVDGVKKEKRKKKGRKKGEERTDLTEKGNLQAPGLAPSIGF